MTVASRAVLATFAAAIAIAGVPISTVVARPPLSTLEIDTASGAHVFRVEVVRTEAERAKGLMYRRSMPRDQGMLFDFEEQQSVTFWMENTYIPLDIVFVDANGRVVGIKHDAKPMDRTLIPSGAPALGVVELNAGVASEIGLAIGDHVKNPLFK